MLDVTYDEYFEMVFTVFGPGAVRIERDHWNSMLIDQRKAVWDELVRMECEQNYQDERGMI